MCGIAGAFGTPGSRAAISACVTSMIQRLVHRGPDQEGVWVDADSSVGLGHRRLSILDLSDAGRQPMVSCSGRYVIAFNGEIYNFKAIKTQLVSKGHQFRGNSDTEVLLAAIDVWGIDSALEKFVGMFAFALWDRHQRQLTICRDRIGEKPLYYGWHDGVFWFASELKAIVAVTGSLAIDRDTLISFMRFGYVPAPWSIYQQIYKLPPGCLLTLSTDKRPADFSPLADTGKVSPKSYWTVAAAIKKGQANMVHDPAQAIIMLDDLLLKTITLQSVADVPVGAFLSGGVDSSVVVALMQAQASRPVNTFTVGYEEQEFDESPFATKIADHLGTHHRQLIISSSDTLGVIPDLATIYDEPFADSSQIPTYLISKLAREHVTVALSGDGGDELFAGYNRYFACDQLWARIGAIPQRMRAPVGRLLSQISPQMWDRGYQAMIGRWRDSNQRQRNIGLKAQKVFRLLQCESLSQAYLNLLSFWPQPESFVVGGTEPADAIGLKTPAGLAEFMDQAMYWDQVGYLPGDNLAKVDRASMAASLETRLPLLSHEVVEFAWQLPLAQKYRDGQSKWLLRQVLYKYVPEEMIERPKMGFSVPVAEWLRGPLKQWGADLLSSDRLRRQGYLEARKVEIAWQQHQTGVADHGNGLWAFLMFQSWLDSVGAG